MMATSDSYNFVNLMIACSQLYCNLFDTFSFTILENSQLIRLAQYERNCLHRVGFHQLSAKPFYATRMIG